MAQSKEFLNAEDVNIPEGMPQPMLWRILVAPVRPKRMSRGGIELVPESVDNQEHLTNVCKVMAMGAMAGKKDTWPEGAWDIKVGDWVVIGQYAGQRFEFQGVKLILLNDDEVLAKAESPEGFRIYI